MSALEIIKDLQLLAEREARGETSAKVHSQLVHGIQRLQASITTPAEKLFRMRFDICQTVCVRLAQQHGILQNLSKDGHATAAELSVATGADELLIGRLHSNVYQKKSRLLRYLAVRIMRPLSITGLVVELGSRNYEATLATRFFASQGIAGGCKY